MTPITYDQITRAKDSPAARREICGTVAANLSEANPSETYAYDEVSVYLLVGAKVVLIWGWTIFGAFRQVSPALDVSEYVKRDTLAVIPGRPLELADIFDGGPRSGLPDLENRRFSS